MTFGLASTFSTRRILPPVGKASGLLHSLQTTGTLEWENAVVKATHVGHLRERNSECGFGTRVFFLQQRASCWAVGWRISTSNVVIAIKRPTKTVLLAVIFPSIWQSLLVENSRIFSSNCSILLDAGSVVLFA